MTPASYFECPLCAQLFTHGEQACETCPLRPGCDVVRCPGCGYTFPRTSLLVEWVRRWWRQIRGAAHEP